LAESGNRGFSLKGDFSDQMDSNRLGRVVAGIDSINLTVKALDGKYYRFRLRIGANTRVVSSSPQ
jgi:hypothetical protein